MFLTTLQLRSVAFSQGTRRYSIEGGIYSRPVAPPPDALDLMDPKKVVVVPDGGDAKTLLLPPCILLLQMLRFLLVISTVEFLFI
jgi:hypothetical protein